MDPMNPRLVAARQRDLLGWFDREGRDLPWRRRRTVYGTWIAEMMLQQTTVKTVIPRWEAFLGRFPDVAALAAADETEVLAAWAGLGYYRRARLLHAAARQVMATGGALPTSAAQWRALPGVGVYAAGAIASMGQGEAAVAVDANVRRVISRWTCADPAVAGRLTAAALRDRAEAHLVADRPGDWNEAVMDLGAGPCRAGEPDCAACPVRRHCAAGCAGTAAAIPPANPRAPIVPVVLGALVLRRAGSVLLLPSAAATVARARGLGRPRRRDLRGLFSGMLSVPVTPWYDAAVQDAVDEAPGRLAAAWPGWWAGLEPQAAGEVRHTITNHRLRVVVHVAEGTGSRSAVDGSVWIPLSACVDQPLSTLTRRVLSRVPDLRDAL
jgi:A/G-specific adenine glycosylase